MGTPAATKKTVKRGASMPSRIGPRTVPRTQCSGNSSLEVVVYQNVFYHYWFPHRDYPWYYDDFDQRGRYNFGGQGQVIKRETLKTDATGKAMLAFDTPRANYNQDYEYRIEARVTD